MFASLLIATLFSLDAETARVSLTDAAEWLGYEDKRDLSRLADRNVDELTQFGVMDTVTITVKRGPVMCQIEEPTCNQDQFTLLAMASEAEAMCFSSDVQQFCCPSACAVKASSRWERADSILRACMRGLGVKKDRILFHADSGV